MVVVVVSCLGVDIESSEAAVETKALVVVLYSTISGVLVVANWLKYKFVCSKVGAHPFPVTCQHC